MEYLKVKNVSFKYSNDKFKTLQNISFTINQGKIAVLIGPNGAGKSTLVKAILNLIKYKGQISIAGHSNRKHLYEVGYMPQKFDFSRQFPITVWEFLNLSLVSCHHSKSEKSMMIDKALANVKADSYKNFLLRDLSGGQLQRVLLARALVHQPKLLILDEPESGVDILGETQIFKLLKDIVKSQKLTLLLVSHNLDMASDYTDQVICLNKSLICSGKPKDVLSKTNLINLYKQPVKFAQTNQ